jgi:cytochrome c oxidase subunit 1
MRCPGMTLAKMPLLAWLNLVMAVLVILAVSPLSAAQIMLAVDRYLGGHFFDTQAGGSAVIWMHFFWIFGHPEVYVLVIPAFAFASEIIPVFSRKAIFGYPVMVAATVCIAFISMSVWAHHLCSLPWLSLFRPASRSSTGWPPCGVERFTSRRPCCSALGFSFNS